MKEADAAGPAQVELVIFGGGIAGLWLLNLLRRAGWQAVLLESSALGGGQTMLSQGLVHGGLKYALDGFLGSGARALRAMPAAWMEALQGRGDVDLGGLQLRSADNYLCASQGPGSRVLAALAKLGLAGAVEKVPISEASPALLQAAPTAVVYRLKEPVLDVPQVVARLHERCADCIFAIDAEQLRWRHEDGRLQGLVLETRSGTLRLDARHWVFCAGAGNEQLLSSLGQQTPRMQRRPLHQVWLRAPDLAPLYAHFLGAGRIPRLTVSTHSSRSGDPVWYLGGALAEQGVRRGGGEQISAARAELAALLPGWKQPAEGWHSVRVDRAELKQEGLRRPAGPYVRRHRAFSNLIVVWPTKLALAPAAARQVHSLLPARHGPSQGDSSLPRAKPSLPEALASLPPAPLARPPWDD